MITLCLAAKGGSGTTVVACARAIHSPGPSLLVDLDGDAPAVLGLAEPDRPGVIDWLASHAPISHIDDLVIDVAPDLSLLPASGPGGGHDTRPSAIERWAELAEWLAEWAHDTGGSVVIDAGIQPVPASFAERCPTRWLVTRSCYLSLRRASRLTTRPTGVILIDEPGRALSRRDVENATSAPVVVRTAWDSRVARSVDCGLLMSGRLSRSLGRDLARAFA